MAINWNSIRTEHVIRAFELLAKDGASARLRGRSLFVTHQGISLPAKDVLRLAYLLANDLPVNSKLKFSSGEGTMARLIGLGFTVERRQAPQKPKNSANNSGAPQ